MAKIVAHGMLRQGKMGWYSALVYGTLGGGKAVLSPGWYCDLLGLG